MHTITEENPYLPEAQAQYPARRPPDNGSVEILPPRGEVQVSVRNLVEFLLRSGDIDNRRQTFSESAMQDGSRVHRMIQRRMGPEYRAEVTLRYTYETPRYTLVVDGRADGIIEEKECITIDEIKGTYRDLTKMKGPVPLHVAQAKCYACIYGQQQQASHMYVRMTYCNMDTEDIRYFYEDFSMEELEQWFQGLLADYQKWADYIWEWRYIRQASIEKLEFPFPYREGQKELAAYVYQTIFHGRKLFLEAPTGVGKTISTVFPAVKAMGKSRGDKLFYLTAKTITRTVAEDTLALLRQRGLRFKSILLTAKDKICFLEKAECNPESCPYAKGHFDRINDALFDLLIHEESFTRERLEEYARRHRVCPFEMGLDMSLFADGIICDYNYLFDPHVYLKRFFAAQSKDYLFLIDEAHNLLERGREMYSATLYKEDFLSIKREIKMTMMSESIKKPGNKGVAGQLTLDMTLQTDNSDSERTHSLAAGEVRSLAAEEAPGAMGSGPKSGRRSVLVRKGYGERLIQQLEYCNKELLALKRECGTYCLVDSIESFVSRLLRLYSTLGDYLGEQEEPGLSVREQLLEFYFEVGHFLEIYERVDRHYVKYTQLEENGGFFLKLFCVNPCENLKECMARGRSSILFSATLLPIQYYKALLGGEPQDYEVYAKSVFFPEKRGLFIAGDVTSKYTRRSKEEYYNIARYIEEVVKNRHGNYMVFCPSYAFLRNIYETYMEHFAGGERECILQKESMSEEEREQFLARFQGADDCDLQTDIAMEIEMEPEERMLMGFCVLGGVFGEGIDLKRDSLIGAIIVGTGLPQVCPEREILKEHFDEGGESGFDYSYRYPGMNKVLQAAGRVIRTMEDVGIVVLLDERFLQPAYRRMFPREWEKYETVTVDTVGRRVEKFWDEWL